MLNIKMFRVAVPVSLLALGGVLLSTSCAPAQPNGAPKNKGQRAQNQGAQGQGDATAFAQIGDAAPKKRFAVPPVDAPQDVPLKPTNYPVPAGAIFVSPDAKPNGNGTQNSPSTLRNALKTAPAGATVVLRGGVYRDGDLPITRQMTLQSFPGESAWLDGSEVVTDWVQDGPVWRRDDWTTVFPTAMPPANIDPQYPLSNNRDMVWINGKYQTQVGTREEVGPNKFWVDYAAKKLFIGDDPSGKTIEATTHTNGFLLRGRDIETAQGSIIRGLGIRRMAEAGVEVQLSRTVLENNTIVWNGNYGVQIRNFGKGTPAPNDVVLRGNMLSCNGQNGVRSWMAGRLLVEGNTFSHNNIENYRRAWGAAGIKVMSFDGLIFRNNLVKKNYSFGLWLDENANDATIVNNQVEGNEVAGIMFEISHRALIAFNVVHDNNVGLMISNSTQGSVWNNTFANNKIGAQVKQGRRPNHQTPEEGDFFLTRDIVLQNNLFAAQSAKSVLLDAGSGAGAAPDMITASDFNVYAPAMPLALAKWKTGAQSQNFQDLAAFQTATGQEKNSLQAAADPFVAARLDDYRLKAGALNARTAPLPASVAGAASASPSVTYPGALPPMP